jgi:hypothetical protein
MQALQLIGPVSDVPNVVAFLASGRPRWIIGAVIPVFCLNVIILLD